LSWTIVSFYLDNVYRYSSIDTDMLLCSTWFTVFICNWKHPIVRIPNIIYSNDLSLLHNPYQYVVVFLMRLYSTSFNVFLFNLAVLLEQELPCIKVWTRHIMPITNITYCNDLSRLGDNVVAAVRVTACRPGLSVGMHSILARAACWCALHVPTPCEFTLAFLPVWTCRSQLTIVQIKAHADLVHGRVYIWVPVYIVLAIVYYCTTQGACRPLYMVESICK